MPDTAGYSALVPLTVEEPETARLLGFHRANPDVVVWALTAVEVASALQRRVRQRGLTPRALRKAEGLLADLERRWAEVTDLGPVTARARRLVRLHPLGAADALQLGAALHAVGGEPETSRFVTLDRQLGGAASREGFTIFPDRS